MPALVTNGIPIFTDIDGDPLEDGYIYIGKAGLNPLSDPLQAYWDSELTIPATNIRTKGGAASNNGTPGRLYVATNYSILVQDKKQRTIYSVPNSVDYYNSPSGDLLAQTDTIATLRQIVPVDNGQTMKVSGYYNKGDITTIPLYIWDNGSLLDDNGGSVIKPDSVDGADPGRWVWANDSEAFVEWYGAVGDGIAEDYPAFNAALTQGNINLSPDKEYKISTTINISNTRFINGAGRFSSLINFYGTGECIKVYSATADDIAGTSLRDFAIVDYSPDRENTWSLELSNVPSPVLEGVGIRPETDYIANNYSTLSTSERQALFFGLNITNNTFTLLMNRCGLSKAKIRLGVADCEICNNIIWSNERDYTVNIRGGSSKIINNQMIQGEIAGIYSSLADVTHMQISDNYFDGNTRSKAEIPTGHAIQLTGNLRRSNICDNRFFISGWNSIRIEGILKSSAIVGNYFSNGDSMDDGFGDIYINQSTGSNITGNSFFRDNLAQKTGSGRTAGAQSPIEIVTAGTFDEPTQIISNTLEGVNSYIDSVYPDPSAVETKNNHIRIGNYNGLRSNYSELKATSVFNETTFTAASDLDDVTRPWIRIDNLFELGITGSLAEEVGWLETVRLQNNTTLETQSFSVQRITLEAGKMLTRTQTSGVWSAWFTYTGV